MVDSADHFEMRPPVKPIAFTRAGFASRLVMTTLIPAGLLLPCGYASEHNVIGSYGNWPTTWQILPGISDTADTGIAPELDFVGDASNPGIYYADNGTYLFCRMRVNLDTYLAPSGAHLWLIDVVGAGNTGIDAAFSWDSKSNNSTSHGLEMSVPSVNGPTWGVTSVDDIDRSNGQKLVNDINGSGRTTDGYVRMTDGQATTNFGASTFIDFAVSWSYLETYTILRKAQTWQVNVASISNATDHNQFNADIGNNATPANSITTAWSSAMTSGVVTVPEPSGMGLLAVACALGLGFRRRGSPPS